ncbi:MAG: MazG family protein [Acidobacteria bacterium]|nr:MazG family protein [Acidobacteriota bacterium]
MNSKADIQKLVDLVARLRGENGCPWDREQTRETLKPMLIEEAYEVLDALDGASPAELKEELGDLLFQVVFHAQIAQEKGEFRLADIIDRLHEKMVRRHPHVFGGADLRTADDVLRNWEDIKAAERGTSSASSPDSGKSLLDGIPSRLPALHQAYQMTAKASRVGFDWPDLEAILEKLKEEAAETLEAHAAKDQSRLVDEAGDLLFVAVNVARFLGVDPETALRHSNRKFERRFRYVEAKIKGQGRELKEASLAEMDALWDEAKKLESDSAPEDDPSPPGTPRA